MLTSRIVITILVNCWLVVFSTALHTEDRKPNATNQVYLYRVLNWCIIGRGEYTLNEWPLSQFKPILQMTRKNEKVYLEEHQTKIDEAVGAASGTNVNPWDKYDLEISPISCAGLKDTGLGDGSDNFLQRIHVQFKPKSATDLIAFQGFLIQAVHAPFGLGFPFGVFDTNGEFECSDCKHFKFSRIIGCISRPDFSPLHPTVAMYHFKMRYKLSPNDTAISGSGDTPLNEVEYGYQSELHWNFKWANIPCSSARLVEFWVLMVLDFERRIWTVKKFGPYDLNDFAFASKLDDPKKITIGTVDIVQPGLPTPIIPDCHPFKANPLIIGEQGRPHSCFRQYKSYNYLQCQRWERKIRFPSSPGSQPPGNATTGPATGTAEVNDFFTNIMICDAGGIAPTALSKTTRVRVVGDFDVQCTRRYPGKFYETMFQKTKRQPYKVCPEWQGKFHCGGSDDDLHFDSNIPQDGPDDTTRAYPASHCIPCKPVTEEVTEPPSDEEPFFKRKEHGVFMIYAFFFFNPVSLNIARFYKETLHEKQVKGWRLWLIIHVGFAAFASMFSYIGYTYPSFTEIDAHITLGYGAMIGVSSGILTGWFRHKNNILQTCMFYVHALSGYLGWILAIASMVFAPFISKWTRLVSYMASAICLAAMAIMSIHICSVDSNLGMRPKRSHIPIIEIRFDDIVPPKSKFRKVFLYIYIILQFLICFGMLVL